MKQIVRAILKALRGQEPESEVVEIKAQREPQLDDLHIGREPEDLYKSQEPAIAEFRTDEPQLDYPHNDRQPEMERIRGRDEAIWLEERPKVIEAIKSGVAELRETSARMRATRLGEMPRKLTQTVASAGTSTRPANSPSEYRPKYACRDHARLLLDTSAASVDRRALCDREDDPRNER